MVEKSNNPGGGKPDKLIRDALMAAIRHSPQKLKKGAEALLEKLEIGDDATWRFVADRIDGKAIQPIGGDSDHPIEIIQRIQREIIDPSV